MSSILSSAAKKRILSDLKHLQEEPIPLAAAAPCSDDISLWNGIIGAQMEVTNIGFVTVPLHFLIEFPCDYPSSAPKIGFSFEFEYRGGASCIMREGRLVGKKVICLDVLGNFDFVHTEWKQTVGSGWSPAYTVTTLLIQFQSVLSDLGDNMSQKERDVTYQSAVRFCEKNTQAILEIMDEDEIRELRSARVAQQQLLKICRNDTALAEKVNGFANKLGLKEKEDDMQTFLELLSEVASMGSSQSSDAESEPKVDSNICCWSTGKLYTQALLGVGINRERKNLSTAAELLSKEAFDGGLRQNTDKSPFEFFLPVWINQAHAADQAKWQQELLRSVKLIAARAFEVTDEDEVFPRLINQMIVEMMRPDASKSAAIATFEALCNFWRTFRWLVDTRPKLRGRVGTRLSNFVKDESFRHKDRCPDIGALLVLFTVLQGDKSCPSREEFLQHYADDNSLRWVMWWQRSNTPPQGAPVFQATQVSREILMFQMTVIEVVIGDVPTTLKEMELTNCKLPQGRLQLTNPAMGLSCKFTPGKPLSTKAGTPYYVAPQVLAGNYDQLSDLWSCGVIMYVLMCGYPPFFGDTDSEVLAKVRLGNFNFNPADWKNVSEDAKTLIRHLLKMNPKDRYTAEQALNHEWIKNKAPKASAVALQSNFVDNLRGFRSQNKLKKAALHIIAGQLNEDQIKALRDTFMGLDKNGDGLLTPAELKEGLQKAGLKDIPPDLQAIMEDVDADGSGVIDYTEFLAATLDRRQYIQEDVCWSAFRVFDRNGDGKISQDELKMVLHNSEVEDTLGNGMILDLLKEVDGNGDGVIDFQEFLQMMRGGKVPTGGNAL